MKFDPFAFGTFLGPLGWLAITPLITTNVQDQGSTREATSEMPVPAAGATASARHVSADAEPARRGLDGLWPARARAA
ncbi:MAG: hypothetical protein ACE5LL_04105 [Alphaproteobacteria bacterium]